MIKIVKAEIEKVSKWSILDIAYDIETGITLVEIKRSGRMRVLHRATSLADCGSLRYVVEEYLRSGVAVSSRVMRLKQEDLLSWYW